MWSESERAERHESLLLTVGSASSSPSLTESREICEPYMAAEDDADDKAAVVVVDNVVVVVVVVVVAAVATAVVAVAEEGGDGYGRYIGGEDSDDRGDIAVAQPHAEHALLGTC